MDGDSAPHRKRKKSSRSESRSDHKHDYEPCIVREAFRMDWQECCKVCGRVRTSPTWKSRDYLLIKEESRNKPGLSVLDYLTIQEVQERFPGVRIFEWVGTGHGEQFREVLPQQK